MIALFVKLLSSKHDKDLSLYDFPRRDRQALRVIIYDEFMQACFRIIDTLDLSYSVTARSDLVGGTSFVARVPKDLQVG